MQLVEVDGHRVLIDCGILFPRDDHFGLNFLIPDFYSILHDLTLDAIIITHGHEDHIGAISFLAKHYPSIPIYAPAFAAALIRKKTEELKLSVKVHLYDHMTPMIFGSLHITPIPVSHSIPHTFGLLLTDQNNTYAIAYLSDFKLDQKQELIASLKEKLSSARLKIMMTDSTNVLNDAEGIDEAELAPHFFKIFSESKSRIFLTCFSSNIYRLQTIIDQAAATGRIVVPHGRSMHFYISTAKELGLLHDSHNVLREVNQIDTDRSNQIVLLSGCQGEFKGTLRRVAFAEDSSYKPNSDDLFVFSSKTIPGNEFSIGQILNELSHRKIPIITAQDQLIHASGHLAWSSLSALYQQVAPDLIIPVHGESFFLLRHVAKIAQHHPSLRSLMLTNGDTLEINSDSSFVHQAKQETDPLFIHGNDLIIERTALSERRKLSSEGLISVSIDLESVHRRHPRTSVDSFGLPQVAKDQLEAFDAFLIGFLKQLKITDKIRAQEEIRVATRRYFMPLLGYRPVAIIHLH